MLKKYKHVIWDWNGTLLDDVELCADLMNNLLKSKGLRQISVDQYREVFTFPVKDYYQKLGHDVSDENWEILSHKFIDEYESRKSECGLYTNAEDVLEKINSKGISQSVLSAYSQDALTNIIKDFELDKYFIKLVGLNNIYAASKVENGVRWMKELGYEKGEVLMIGDTIHDYEVATEMGADALLVANGHQSKEKLLTCTDNVVDSVAEILTY